MLNINVDSDLDKMLSVISHEMKSPISLIKANVELLKLKHNSDTENFDMIFRELENLESISQNFIQAIKYNNKDEKVFLIEIVEEVIESYELSHTNIHFEINCEEDDINIYGSYHQIKILVNNLIKNSVEAIYQQGITGFVNVKIYKHNEKVVLEVIDNGIGLSNTNKEAVYNKYYTTKKDGSGLGLSIIKYILSSKNAHIRLDNNIYGGCTATVIWE